MWTALFSGIVLGDSVQAVPEKYHLLGNSCSITRDLLCSNDATQIPTD